MVTVIVGKEQYKRTFAVHKSLISHYSTFFKNAFTSVLVEGESQMMTLEDVDSSAFGLVIHWLYTQDLKGGAGDDAPSVFLLAHIWSLAGRFNIPQLQNTTMENFQARLGSLDNWDRFLDVILYVYEDDKPKDSPLRKLAAQKMSYGMRERWTTEVDKFPSSFMADVMAILFDFHDKQPLSKLNQIPSDASGFYIDIKDENE
jgi:hypothetical protein